MAKIDQETVACALKITSLVSLGVYAGSATAMACPVSLGVQKLKQPSCRLKVVRCLVKGGHFFPVTAILAETTAVGAYLATRGTANEDKSMLIGAGAVLALVPFAMAFMKPIRDRLLDDTEIPDEEAGPLVEHFFKLHIVPSVVSLAAFGYLTYKAVCKC